MEEYINVDEPEEEEPENDGVEGGFQLIDPDTYGFGGGGKENLFNHDMIVMTAYMNCIKSGAVEMVKGYWEEKRDKFGNILNVYHSDARLMFISSVETLKNCMRADFENDAVAKQRLKVLYEKIRQMTSEAITQEEEHFNRLPAGLKQKFPHAKGHLNQDSLYYQNLVNAKVELYRLIFEELELCLARLKYLKKKILTN